MRAAAFQTYLTPAFVAEALSLNIPAILAGSDPQPFTAVVTDSRKILPGCLFVALVGERLDGHDFVAQAVAAGARGVVCRKGTVIRREAGHERSVHVFPSDDTLQSYRRVAGAWRREFSIPLVAVAGSVGKTTTKELLAAALQGRYAHVLKTQGSQNGFVGIPMTLFELRAETQAAVIEVGIDEIGAMAQHMALINATASVLTAIGPEHLERLRDVPTVAREEGIALSVVAQAGGFVGIHLDDPWIRPHFSTLRQGRKIGFSMHGAQAPGDVLTGRVTVGGDQLEVSGLGLKHEFFPMPLRGAHNASNLMAALTMAVGLGLSAEEIRQGLKGFRSLGSGRSELRELPGPTPVVCDYYNANPTSMEAGLSLLAEVASLDRPKARTRWACLADMLEMGPEREALHRGLAPKLFSLGIENVLLFGSLMGHLAEELEKRGFPGRVAHFENREELAAALCDGARPGDAILIKGSRGMRMEEVWKGLEAHAQAHWGTGSGPGR